MTGPAMKSQVVMSQASEPASSDEPERSERATSQRPLGRGASLVPERSIAGRALISVVAIMTFLAAVTAGAVNLVALASADWRSAISKELTIQIRPANGRDIEADVARATTLARETAGISEARMFTRQESERLLEPWLGTGLNLNELPVPRVIVLKLGGETRPDLADLRQRLQSAMPGVTLDDHRLWVERLAAMANTIVFVGIAIVALVLSATALAVAFATRAAVAGNRDVLEVLHFVGAKDQLIKLEFARHFLKLGLQGGGLGALCAILCLWLAGFASARMQATAGGDQIEALFGAVSVGITGYLVILVIAAIVAGLTAAVSWRTVDRHLKKI